MAENKQEQEAPTIHWRINEWFTDLSPDVKARLKTYHNELIKGNRTVNLISPKTLFVADAVHFADSILASKIITKSNPSIDQIYDLGSGNGFPGLVFAIVYPHIKVVLVEVDAKKCEFLRSLVQTLGLENASVECKNIETYPEGSIKYAMARGLGNISKSIMMTRKIVAKGGSFFHLKTEEWGIEVGEIPTQLCSLWSPSLIGEYKLPVGAVKFAVVKTDKIG